MSFESQLGGIRVLRPLLEIPGESLREYLHAVGQAWREDASNASDAYLRNRLRRILAAHPDLAPSVLETGQACRDLHAWVQSAAPVLDECFDASQLQGLQPIIAEAAARRWLIARGVPAGQISPRTIAQLLAMATDAASSSRLHFPGGILVRRKSGKIRAE